MPRVLRSTVLLFAGCACWMSAGCAGSDKGSDAGTPAGAAGGAGASSASTEGGTSAAETGGRDSDTEGGASGAETNGSRGGAESAGGAEASSGAGGISEPPADTGGAGPVDAGGAAGSRSASPGGHQASAGAGGATASGPDEPLPLLDFDVDVALSPSIGTVAIVTWSVDSDALEAARIEFGRDGTVEYVAPVDLEADRVDDGHIRTLLLGMKPASTYDFRIIVTEATGEAASPWYSVDTEAWSPGIPSVTVRDLEPDRIEGGFLVTSSFNDGSAFILDGDGDVVWWRGSGTHSDGVRARFTYDGRAMILANGNVPGPSNGALVRVSLDGLDETVYDVPGRHHDAEVLPDGGIATLVYDQDGQGTCDRIVRVDPDGTTSDVFALRDHFADYATDAEWCHSNAIDYLPDEDAFIVSVLNLNAFVKFSADGELLWVFGGEANDFGEQTWVSQHQFRWLGDHLLFFNNRADGSGDVFAGGTSRVLEYQLDETGFEASLVWEYPSPGPSTFSFGDVERLPNGNTLVTYSNNGELDEVDPEGVVVRITTLDMTHSPGYVEWRESLYGPPQQYR